jgi:SAM-dependent methyltransferase
VLDVGCSDGYLASLLAERGYTVTGIEKPSGHTAAFPPNVKLIEHDLEQGLPHLEQRFSYIVCADILEHLRDPLALLRQLEPLLESGGRLIASLPNSGNIYFRLNVLLGRFPQDDRGLFDRTHVRFYVWDGWVQLLAEAGFRVASVKSSSIPFSLAFPDPSWRFAVNLAEQVYFGLARLWKTLFAYQFVVTAVRSARAS